MHHTEQRHVREIRINIHHLEVDAQLAAQSRLLSGDEQERLETVRARIAQLRRLVGDLQERTGLIE